MHILLKSPTGIQKKVKIGLSWTTLFFGVFPALFRADLKWFIIQLLAGFLTGGYSVFFFFLFYNRLYIKDLLRKGYEPANKRARIALVRLGHIAE